MGINMRGHVSGPFITHPGVQLNRLASEVDDYQPVLSLVYSDEFDANVQPLNDREIEFLQIGGERANDYRVIHRNDGKGMEISNSNKLADILIFAETPDKPVTWWKVYQCDNRPWHNFSRAVVARMDPEEISKLQASNPEISGNA